MTDAPSGAQSPTGSTADRWRDASLPVADRVADLLALMTLEEKAGQLVGYWPAADTSGGTVAPHQDDFSADAPPLDDLARNGLGQLTRVFGTAPVSAADGAVRLRELQTRVAEGNRFGIPAIAHEECLTGFTTYAATVFPCPLAWGASFDPDLVQRMAAAIGSSMRSVGVHQGLSPVLDVTRDYRWGRTEETIGEDPYLVGQIGAAYVRGLESAGIVATLKHFAGYSTSRGGRNLAPAAIGPRELADVVLEPFVVALREGGARAVMHSYADVDGVPAAADEALLTGLLRDRLGFDGLVVADYYGISFLQTLHGVAGSPAEAAVLALRAGVDVELPTVRCYGEPLVQAVRAGEVDEALVDRAVGRVLALKGALGLLDQPVMESGAVADAPVDLDPPEHRALARQLAEESVVLLANNGVLPLAGGSRRLALVGPLADDARAMLGCYSFPGHVGRRYPDMPLGVGIPTVAAALQTVLPDSEVVVSPGCAVDDVTDGSHPDADAAADMQAAVDAAQQADVTVLVLGDRAGMFGGGTSGEGCDAESLDLPGRQAMLADAVLSTGTPTVLVLLTGRPYALAGLAERADAVVWAFFPGEEGGTAVAGVLAGRVEVSGRLPVSVPRTPAGQPATYLHAPLAGATRVSSVDPTPLYPFGHGLTWTRFTYSDLIVISDDGGDATDVRTDGVVRVLATVRNTGERAGTDVVQLYLSDPVATVVRPVRWLAGWARVRLEPGCAAQVAFTVHADRTSFTGGDLRRRVEPGLVEVAAGPSSGDLPLRGAFTLTGAVREPGAARVLRVPVEVTNL